MELPADPPSSVLGGEAFLARIYEAYRAMQSPRGSNIWNTALLIGWDEPGGTYDHVPPGPVPPPDPSAPTGEMGFGFDRSGYRVPAVIVSPWVEPGSVYKEEHRHTSLIATLREQWQLGDPFTARDAVARSFSDVFVRETPSRPDTWPAPQARPVPLYAEDDLALGTVVSMLGKTLLDAIRGYAEQNNIELAGVPKDPGDEIPPEQVVRVLRSASAVLFPLLAEGDRSTR
jgi:phospholipase C